MFDRFIQDISERAEKIGKIESPDDDNAKAFRSLVWGLKGANPLPFEMLSPEEYKAQIEQYELYFVK